MNARLTVCAALLALVSLSAQAQENRLLAVLPLDVHDSRMDAATEHGLEEAIRTTAGDAVRSYGYTVLTGETTLAVLSDNGVDAAKACEASCALQAARELKADLFISGSVTTTEGAFLAFIRLFENKTGRQLGSVEVEGTTVREIRKAFEAKAPGMFSSALNLAKNVQPTSAVEAAKPVVDARRPVVEAPKPVVTAPVPQPVVETPDPAIVGLDTSLITSNGHPRTLHFQLAPDAKGQYGVEIVGAGKRLKCPFPVTHDNGCDLSPVPASEVQVSLFDGTRAITTQTMKVAELGSAWKLQPPVDKTGGWIWWSISIVATVAGVAGTAILSPSVFCGVAGEGTCNPSGAQIGEAVASVAGLVLGGLSLILSSASVLSPDRLAADLQPTDEIIPARKQ